MLSSFLQCVSIRATYTGGDRKRSQRSRACKRFQSAPPIRVAMTLFIIAVKGVEQFQSAPPIRVAMATHSQIRPFRALAPPHRPQNRHNLGNPLPRTHPCARPLREKTCRFYVHLGFALERFFGLSHRHLCRGCKFSVIPPNKIGRATCRERE